MKNSYLSHWSALKSWNASLVLDYFGARHHLNETTHITVFNKAYYYKRKGLTVHLCTSKVLRGALLECNGQPTVSPEFAFMQLSAVLPIHERILLGLLLCAKPNGRVTQQVTTRKRLLRFIRKCRRHYGRARALSALRYVRDGCYSIMEAFQHMAFCLPHRLGGGSLGEGELNYRVRLKPGVAKALGQRSCVVDLVIRKYMLGLELDSRKFHDNAVSFGRDSERLAALALHGIIPYSVKPSQLYKPRAFWVLLKSILARIRKRLHMRNKRKFLEMFKAWHQLLPRLEPVAQTG